MASFPMATHDVFALDDLLTPEERATRYRVRAFMESEVAPIIAEHWEKASFPFEIVPKLGALGVTALLLLYPELPVVRIAASDIAHAVPLTLIAGMGHLATGGIDTGVLVSLLCGSLPGIILASLFAPRLPDRALRIILAVTLTIVAVRLLSA